MASGGSLHLTQPGSSILHGPQPWPPAWPSLQDVTHHRTSCSAAVKVEISLQHNVERKGSQYRCPFLGWSFYLCTHGALNMQPSSAGSSSCEGDAETHYRSHSPQTKHCSMDFSHSIQIPLELLGRDEEGCRIAPSKPKISEKFGGFPQILPGSRTCSVLHSSPSSSENH